MNVVLTIMRCGDNYDKVECLSLVYSIKANSFGVRQRIK